MRLRRIDEIGSITAIDEAVARICLSEVQDQLPQWASVSETATVLGRKGFGRRERRQVALLPVRLLTINWADSGPGFSWPEDYRATSLPGFGRTVVTASADSIDAYGVADFAIGWFPSRQGLRRGGRRILLDWWARYARNGGGSWEYLFDEGVISAADALGLRELAWGNLGGSGDCPSVAAAE